MPKGEGTMTPKAIANKIKSKGLQKLRWYCQMCQKQCRDENGFKCHIMSESHQRQLLLVADNPGRFVGNFSDEFLKGFMDILRRQYGTRRVNCNVVYQEYIRDKDHYHMNATRWSTLTGFVMWLGRQGLCEVEPTPKGWYITYIDRSPEALERQAADAKKIKMDRDDEERTQLMIEDQIVRATALKKCNPLQEDESSVFTDLQRKDEDEKITLKLFKTSNELSDEPHPPNETHPPLEDDLTRPSKLVKLEDSTAKVITNPLKLAEFEAKTRKIAHKQETDKKKKSLSSLDTVFKLEEERKEKMNRKDYWLHVGIVVKVLNKKLDDSFYKKKGYIEELHDQYTASVRMIDSRDKIKIDQCHLETVIPAIGRSVLIVNGAYRGYKAKLESINVDDYCVSVTIEQGPSRGRRVEGIAYEDVSKLHSH